MKAVVIVNDRPVIVNLQKNLKIPCQKSGPTKRVSCMMGK